MRIKTISVNRHFADIQNYPMKSMGPVNQLVVGSIPTAGAKLLILNNKMPPTGVKWHGRFQSGSLPFLPFKLVTVYRFQVNVELRASVFIKLSFSHRLMDSLVSQ